MLDPNWKPALLRIPDTRQIEPDGATTGCDANSALHWKLDTLTPGHSMPARVNL